MPKFKCQTVNEISKNTTNCPHKKKVVSPFLQKLGDAEMCSYSSCLFKSVVVTDTLIHASVQYYVTQ